MKRRSAAGTVAALALTCVFGATLLSGLTVGAGIYRRVEARAESSQAQRLGLTYLTTRLHSCDSADAVSVGTFGESDALFLRETVGEETYETILYVHRGQLMELYQEAGWGLSPEDGEAITEAKEMTLTESGGLLRIAYTDTGGQTETVFVALRSEQDPSPVRREGRAREDQRESGDDYEGTYPVNEIRFVRH